MSGINTRFFLPEIFMLIHTGGPPTDLLLGSASATCQSGPAHSAIPLYAVCSFVRAAPTNLGGSPRMTHGPLVFCETYDFVLFWLRS
jgi:hypothetical protein